MPPLKHQTSFCKRCHTTEIAHKVVEGRALFICSHCGRTWTRPVILGGNDKAALAGATLLAGGILGAATGSMLAGPFGTAVGGLIGAYAGASWYKPPPHEKCFRCGGEANLVGTKGNRNVWQCSECGRSWQARRSES